MYQRQHRVHTSTLGLRNLLGSVCLNRIRVAWILCFYQVILFLSYLPYVVNVAGYISTVMFSTAIPGAPAWSQPPEVFDELIKVAGVGKWGA